MSEQGAIPSEHLEEAQAFKPVLKLGWVCGCDEQPQPHGCHNYNVCFLPTQPAVWSVEARLRALLHRLTQRSRTRKRHLLGTTEREGRPAKSATGWSVLLPGSDMAPPFTAHWAMGEQAEWLGSSTVPVTVTPARDCFRLSPWHDGDTIC